MRFFRILAIAAALTLSVGATLSNAATTITGLYNTGVNNTPVDVGTTLAGGTLDSHYTLFSSPLPVVAGNPTFVVDGGFPVPPWVANSPVGTVGGSMWISGNVTPIGAGTNQPNGVYDYRTTFTGGAGVITAATISGFLSGDDSVGTTAPLVTGILLNGVAVAPPVATADQTYGTLFAFSFSGSTTSGNIFNTGLNTLDFLVQNTHNAVQGLRVSGITSTTGVVPEPASVVMLGSGVVGILGFGLRRRKKAI